MAENTNIEWATHSWSPWRGCTKVSAGCANCYADTMSKRNPLTLGVWGPNGTRVVAAESAWKLPLKWSKAAGSAAEHYERLIAEPNYTKTEAYANGFRWTKPERPRVFPSLCDPFEDWQGPMVDSRGHVVNRNGPTSDWVWYADTLRVGQNVATMSDVRRRLFRLIDATRNLDWLLLTKRPENIGKMMPPTCDFCSGFQRLRDTHRCQCGGSESKNCRPNLWLGTSVENQATKSRIDILRGVPAAIRFLSIEPLLEDIGKLDLTGISLVIIGGESGPGARPCNVEWIRDLVRQCREAGVPCFVKQDFGPKPGMRGRLDDELWNTKEIPDAR